MTPCPSRFPRPDADNAAPSPLSQAGLGASGGVVGDSLYAVMNLVRVYNDRLIAGAEGALGPKEAVGLAGARWALTLLASLDVVVEMVAALTGDRKQKWTVVRVRPRARPGGHGFPP